MSTVTDQTPDPSPEQVTEATPVPRPIWGRHLLVLAVLAVVLVPLPLLLPPNTQAVAVRVLIFAIMAVGWNIMSGFGGMFSFGHAAYFGLGAYASVWLLVNYDVSPWIGMLVGMLFAGAFATLIGFLALRYRLRGAYFALATFAFAEMLRLLAINSDFVNRAVGYNVPLRPEFSLAYMQFAPGAPAYFWIALGLTVAAIAVSILFLRSRTGRFTIAVRDDEDAAAAVGVPVMRTKLVTMALSAAVTSVAGTFYAQYYFFIDPDVAFGSSVSIQAILPAVIGGVATIWGPAIGALVLGPLNDVTATLLRNPPDALSFLEGRAGLDVIVYALLLIIIVLLLPQGIYGALRGSVETTMSLLEVRGVSRSFQGLKAVDDVSFDVQEGSILGIIGPNGAGKTTLFNLVAGAIAPQSGTVTLDGRDITGFAPHKVARAGMVRTFQLMKPFGSVSVLENVAVAAMASGTSRHDASTVAARVVDRVGLGRWRDLQSSGLPTRRPQNGSSSPAPWPCAPGCCCSTRCSPVSPRPSGPP